MFDLDVQVVEETNDIVDLTGGATNPAPEETTPEEVVTPEVTEEGSVPEEAPEVVDPELEEDKEDTKEGLDGEFFFEGEAVTVDIPEDVQGMFTEAGVDAKEVVAQLFAKDGKFELTGEVREKLDAKFGKTLVDAYLGFYKRANTEAIKQGKEALAQQERVNKEQVTEFTETVGGEEGLLAIESYVESNLSEKEIKAYNKVMESDNFEAQMFMYSQIKRAMAAEHKLTEGDKNIALVGDKSESGAAGSPLDKGYLTSAEYKEITNTDAYWDDLQLQRRVDAARSAGIKKGTN